MRALQLCQYEVESCLSGVQQLNTQAQPALASLEIDVRRSLGAANALHASRRRRGRPTKGSWTSTLRKLIGSS